MPSLQKSFILWVSVDWRVWSQFYLLHCHSFCIRDIHHTGKQRNNGFVPFKSWPAKPRGLPRQRVCFHFRPNLLLLSFLPSWRASYRCGHLEALAPTQPSSSAHCTWWNSGAGLSAVSARAWGVINSSRITCFKWISMIMQMLCMSYSPELPRITGLLLRNTHLCISNPPDHGSVPFSLFLFLNFMI